MPKPNDVNPRTGKRFAWEAEQAARKADDVATINRQLGLLKRQQKALQARDDFMTFIKFTMPDINDRNDVEKSQYKNAKHHDAVAAVVMEVEAGRIPMLILVMPPRHGKSEQVSRRLPAWYSGRHPEQNIAVGTYSDEFAAKFGKEVRSIMRSPQYHQVFPEHGLQRGGEASNFLMTRAGGQLAFVGRKGSLTGSGAHLLIVDDLIKNAEEARSLAVRDEAWEWFTQVAMTRRMGLKLVILTFTRWHADDPIGRLTDPENPHYNVALAKRFKIIALPAIAEDDDPLGRAPGEALWPDGPDTFDLDFLEEQRMLNPLAFQALYQGRPSALDGDLFKREDIQWYDPHQRPENLRYYATSDHAVGVKQQNDPTCLLKGGIDRDGNLYLTECVWQRMKADVTVERMLDMGARSTTNPLAWWAEGGHISKSIGPFLRKRMLETGQYFSIHEIHPAADKATRAQSIIGRVAMGKVFFPKGVAWAERAVDEMMAFPTGLHDDFVDALALFGLGLRSQFGPGKSKAEKKRVEQPPTMTLDWVKLADRWKQQKREMGTAGGF